jgi:GrpB-like predicted nucleotidyltransferase (UPF0157 family)
MSVTLVEHDPSWQGRFEEEAARVREALGVRAVAIEHIGSTAVPGLASQPVIDLLVGLRGLLADADKRALRRLGYARLRARRDSRIVFRKGVPRTHSLHVTEHGSAEWLAALDFRDRLRAWPDEAARYEARKFALAVRGRGGYSAGKAAFIARALGEPPAGALARRR